MTTAAFNTAMSTLSATSAASTSKVTPQGGILVGSNPSKYDKSNPIVSFIIQAGIIIILCRLIHWPLSRIRQPRVISEIVSGIILGPSVMGRIPGFTDAIFPTASIPALNLVANLGIVLFLFVIGLETDVPFFARNWRVALSVSVASIVLPFALGVAVAHGLYEQYPQSSTFGTFAVFIGIAMGITAFPVLCRILTELKLLHTNVGLITLSAGVGNDIIGWILLALCVAFVNASSGLTALWVLLVCVGYILFLWFVFRPLFRYLLKRTGSLEKGPSQTVVVLTLLMVLASAFFTQVIGVQAIFGGFVVGLACPHEDGFAVKLTETIEDLIVGLFLPLYFTLSGLNTNLGLLDTGTAWAYVVAIVAIAMCGKVAGGTLAARFCGLLWRESFATGVLMSCKGLVELIVLNIGLQAHILSTQTFTMFVVMALVTTFLTTPLTTYLYPEWYQIKVLSWRKGEIDWNGDSLNPGNRRTSESSSDMSKVAPVRNLLVYLRLDGLSAICTLSALLVRSRVVNMLPPKIHPAKIASVWPAEDQGEEAGIVREPEEKPALHVHGIRLIELTDRDSSVMKVSESDQYNIWDPVINSFLAFARWHNICATTEVSVVPEDFYAETIAGLTLSHVTDLLLIPWTEWTMSERLGAVADEACRLEGSFTSFVSRILDQVEANVGVFIERQPYPKTPGKQLNDAKPSNSATGVQVVSAWNDQLSTAHSNHVIFPFFGGADDRFALRFVLQLAQNDQVTATIIHINIPLSPMEATPDPAAEARGQQSDDAFFSTFRDSLSATVADRIIFQQLPVSNMNAGKELTHLVVAAVRSELERAAPCNANCTVVVGRRKRQMKPSSDNTPSSSDETETEIRRILGRIGEAMLLSEGGIGSNVLLLQAGRNGVGSNA